MGDQYSEAAVKLGQYIAPALDREITDEDYPLFDLLLDFAKDKIFAPGLPLRQQTGRVTLAVSVVADTHCSGTVQPHRRKRTDELYQ